MEELFQNMETKLMAKYFKKEIDELLEANKGKSMTDLQCILSEELELIVKEQLSVHTEGYISEIIGDSFDNVNYEALVLYFKD
jgi:hypothetical protein